MTPPAPLPNHYDRMVADFLRVRGFRELPYLECFWGIDDPSSKGHAVFLAQKPV